MIAQRRERRTPSGVPVLLLLADDLVYLAQQHAGLQHVGGQLAVHEVRRHHRAQRLLGHMAHGLEDDLQLRAQLARRAGPVHRAEHPLPEAAAHRQQRVVGRQHLVVFARRADFRLGQLSPDLSTAGAERRLYLAQLIGCLAQHDLARDRLHIGVRQFDGDGEAPLQPLEQRGAVQGRLPGAHEQYPAGKALAAGLRQLLHRVAAIGIVADVLLHLVQHDQRAGHLAVHAQDLVDHVQGLVHGDVGDVGELCLEQRWTPFASDARVGVRLQDRLGQRRARHTYDG